MKRNDASILPKNVRNQIAALSNDSIHGSTFLTKKAINIAKFYINEKDPSEINFEILKNMLSFIVDAQPTMALLFSFSNNFLFFLDELNEENKPIAEKKESIITFLDHFSQSLKKGKSLISQNAIRYLLPMSVIATYSSSGTTQYTIEKLAEQNKSITVYCAESRPKYEGTLLAQSLAKKGIEVMLMTDATLFSKIKDVNSLVIGADAITKQGIINKIGSYPLAQLASDCTIPMYCLTHSSKIIPKEHSLRNESKKPDTDLLSEKQKNVNVVNYYFDTTPLNLFNGIITEKGFFQPDDIRKYIQNQSVHPFFRKK